MLLSARFLANVSDVNNFDWIRQVEMNAGDPVTVYVQLVDASLDKSVQGWEPIISGRRYMPASGATLQVQLKNVDDTKTLNKIATQAFPTSDPSIWSFQIAATDDVQGTVSLTLVLTEGAVIRRGLIKAAIRVYPVTPGDC
jgi:hypothetical protein